jgi:hypothetical protein
MRYWRVEKSERKVIKPLEIKKHELLVKKALLLHSRAEKMHRTNSPARSVTAMYHKARCAFEAALEYLEEFSSTKSDLLLWLDRDSRDATDDPIGIPRVIGSSSRECKDQSKSTSPHAYQKATQDPDPRRRFRVS